jgi:ABC-type lipoprotein export system ATPase subunit
LSDAAIFLDRLTATGDDDETILSSVSLDVAAGEAIAVIGPSGSGKSFLLATIAGLRPVRATAARVGGLDLCRLGYLDRRALSRIIGFVFQSGGLVSNRTVRDNIALPLLYRGELEQADVARSVGDLASTLVLTDDLDELAAEVTSSVRKKALYARALVTDPSILLVDDPSGSLPGRDLAVIGELLARRRRQSPLTIVYADQERVGDPFPVDRQIGLANGEIRRASDSLFARPPDKSRSS